MSVELFEKYFQRTLSTADVDELVRLLRDSQEAGKDFVRYLQERSALVRCCGLMKRVSGARGAEGAAAGRRRPPTSSGSHPDMALEGRHGTPALAPRWSAVGTTVWTARRGVVAAAAAAVVVAALGVWLVSAARGRRGPYRLTVGGREISRGSRLAVGPGGARLELGGYCQVEAAAQTVLRIEGSERAEKLFLERGELACEVEPAVGAFIVETELAKVSVTGTRFVVTMSEVDGSEGEMKRQMVVRVLAGSVLLSGACGACELREGQEKTVSEKPQVTVPDRREWKLVGPGTGGAMFSIAIHPTNPRIFYSGVDMGALFKTTDGGETWCIMGGTGPENPNPAPLGAFGVCVDQRNPDNVWSASGDMFKSENAGRTWTRVNTQDNVKNVYFERVVVDPGDGDVAYGIAHHRWTHEGRVARTTDGGKTWEIVAEWSREDPRHWWGMVIDPRSTFVAGKGHSRIYLFGEEELLRSEDRGATWTDITSDMPRTPIVSVVLGPTNRRTGKSVIFASCTPRWVDKGKKVFEGGIYRSDDDGSTWNRKMTGLEEAAAGSGLVNRTGRFWLANSRSRPDVLYYAFGFAGVYRSTDLGESWSALCHPALKWQRIEKNSLGNEDHYMLRLKGGNCRLAHHSSGGAILGLAVAPSDPNVVLWTHNSYIVGTFDGGRTWGTLAADTGQPFALDRWPEVDVAPSDHTHLLRGRGLSLIVPKQAAFDPFDPNRTMACAYMDLGLRVSRDGGEWWEWIYDRSCMERSDSGSANAIVFDPAVNGRLYLGTGKWGVGDVFRSDDHGRTFKRLSLVELRQKAGRSIRFAVERIVIDPGSPPERRTIYAAIDRGQSSAGVGGVWKSVDGGATWGECSRGLGGAVNVRALVMDEKHPEILYAGTYNDGKTGLFRTADGGGRWEHLAPDRIGSITGNCISLCREHPEALYAVAYPPGKAGFWNDRVLFRSDDGGGTWHVVRKGFLSSVAVNPHDPDWLYVTIPRGIHYTTRGGLLRSRDGGKSWDPIDDGVIVEGASRSRIEVDPLDSRRLIHYSLYGVWIGFDPEAPHG